MKAPSLSIIEFLEAAVWASASAHHHLRAGHRHEWVL